MELNEIRYFLALSQTLNFTKAAEICNVSQPALTRAIQKMEDELGGLLFSRERSNTHLTELGRMLKPHLEEVTARTHATRETAARFLRLDGAHISLGVMCTIGPMLFASFLSAFRVGHPGIEMTVLENVPDRLSDLLLNGELDVALMARPHGFSPPLRALPIYNERFVIACSAGHPFARQNVVRVSELDGQSYLSRINCEFRDMLGETCVANGAHLVRCYRSEREDWILMMVAAGMGVCFLPEYSATVPGVVPRPVIDPTVEREVCLVTVAGRRWSPPVATFVQAVQRYPWPKPEGKSVSSST
ncbi:MAG: LysR family transcriptional regulator [Acetobacteraceae bacterium]|nr:LysR family transcriptional regulator [Acetobacteraceae bacterium]